MLGPKGRAIEAWAHPLVVATEGAIQHGHALGKLVSQKALDGRVTVFFLSLG